jgi:Secretion system C-terminal sorting domain
MKASLVTIIFLLAANMLQAQRNLAMYKAQDPTIYYLNTNTQYHPPFFMTDMGPMFSYKIKYSYSINNGTPVQEVADVDHNDNWNGVNGVGFSMYRIALKNPIVFASANSYTIQFWIDSLDGQTDANHSNDTLVRYYRAIDNCPERKGLIEYAYHVSCGPCGEDGSPFYERAIAQFSDKVVCVKLHNYNGNMPAAWSALDCPEAIAIDNAFGSTAHPDFTFNRGSMMPYKNEDNFYPKYTPADSMEFVKDLNYINSTPSTFAFNNYALNATTNQIKFDLQTTFWDAITFAKETRLNVMLVEDSIWYYMAQNGVVGAPDSIYHRYVLRKVFGNVLGQAGSIPSSVAANQIVSFVVNDSVKPHWNKKQLYLIPTIMQYGSGSMDHEILQAQLFNCTQLSWPTSIAETQLQTDVQLYPNPASNILHLQSKTKLLSYEMRSIDGKIMASDVVKSDAIEIDIHGYAAGVYFVRMTDEKGKVWVRKVVVE